MSKPKILITGFNKQQCTRDYFRFNSQLKIVPSHYSLAMCLEDMGYDVEQRQVTIGESLDSYDEVIVFLHNPGGFAEFVYNGLWAIYNRPSCIMAFDDWQTEGIYEGLLYLKTEGKLFREHIKGQCKFDISGIEAYEREFLAAVDTIESKKNRMLVSAFAGGDPTLVLEYPRERMFTYNPNPYNLNRQPAPKFFDAEKERVFNFAGLIQRSTKKWLNNQKVNDTGWPLKLYGSKKDGQDRVTEPEMVNIFADHWGILMAGYFHAGSGWWRARPLQVADAGSILIGDPKEMFIYYKDEQLANVKPMDLVDMKDSQLEELARAQRAALYASHPLDKEVQKMELSFCLNS